MALGRKHIGRKNAAIYRNRNIGKWGQKRHEEVRRRNKKGDIGKGMREKRNNDGEIWKGRKGKKRGTERYQQGKNTVESKERREIEEREKEKQEVRQRGKTRKETETGGEETKGKLKRSSREGNRKADTDSARIKEKMQRCEE